eukprot:scaffold96886_cov33-Tisochrysis_lutea.AAC.3
MRRYRESELTPAARGTVSVDKWLHDLFNPLEIGERAAGRPTLSAATAQPTLPGRRPSPPAKCASPCRGKRGKGRVAGPRQLRTVHLM